MEVLSKQSMHRSALIGCALLLVGFQVQAQEEVEQGTGELDYSLFSYPDEGQPEYDPTDAETDLDSMAPQPGAVFGDVVPEKYFQWKRDLYTNHDLKLGFFYQSLFMSASEISPLGSNDNSWGQWWASISNGHH